jgi:tetratricopeptide (TPR) repeat protein
MALYSKDCVEKIRAIKDAQNKRFLPLMVIRKILEQNEYDYSSLGIDSRQYIVEDSHPNSGLQKTETDVDLSLDAVCDNLGISSKTISLMAGHKWLKLENKGKQAKIRSSDFEFLKQISFLNNNGLDFSKQIHFFESIQDIIEKGVEKELEILIKELIKTPNKYFNESLSVEGRVVQKFINKIRERRLQEYFQTYAELMDNAYFASADEGFALPSEEIEEDLESLEATINETFPNVQKLIWLSTGYSCIGDLKRSLKCLHKALRMAPENLEVKVKMIWYKRFSKRTQDVNRLKKQLIDLVDENPKHTLGHVFLVDWFVLDAQSSNTASGMIEGIKLCLNEIQKMEQAIPQNLHDWALVQYIKGRVYTTFPLLQNEYIEKGILCLEKVLERRSELEKYYSETMPFFPKWLWPNLLYVLGTSYLKVKRFSEAKRVFTKARSYNVSFPFKERLENGLEDAENGLGMN